MYGKVLARLLHALYHRVREDLHALLFEDERKVLPQFLVHVWQQPVHALDEGDPAAQVGIKRGKLHADDTAAHDDDAKNGLYLGGNAQVLIKQIDFKYRSGEKGSAFIVTDMKNVIPEVEELFVDLICVVVIVLIATAFILLMWIYRGIMRPLSKMKRAAYNIKEGNLDFEIKPESDDELGQLCSDLEDMRKRLKDSAEEKIQFDKENKELIAKLQKKLEGSSLNATQLKKTIEGLQAQLVEKEKQLQTLREELDKKDIHIMELDESVNNLNTNVSNLKTESQKKTETINAQDKQLNTAWYVFGTKKELKGQRILENGKVMNGNFNKNYFTKIDIRNTTEIKLYSKSAKLMTAHPSSSYTLVRDANKQYTLRITNPQIFWSTSKYLVVLVK